MLADQLVEPTIVKDAAAEQPEENNADDEGEEGMLLSVSEEGELVEKEEGSNEA